MVQSYPFENLYSANNLLSTKSLGVQTLKKIVGQFGLDNQSIRQNGFLVEHFLLHYIKILKLTQIMIIFQFSLKHDDLFTMVKTVVCHYELPYIQSQQICFQVMGCSLITIKKQD